MSSRSILIGKHFADISQRGIMEIRHRRLATRKDGMPFPAIPPAT